MTYLNDTLLVRVGQFIPKLPDAALTFLIGFMVIRIIQALIRFSLDAAHITKTLQQILQSIIGSVLWLALIALIFQSLGLNQIALGLSGVIAVAGVGIAAGGNKLVTDIFAGLFLAKNRDFKIGQRVKVDQAAGRIHSLDSRKVRILSDEGNLFVIPNGKFDDMIWEIMADDKDDKRR